MPINNCHCFGVESLILIPQMTFPVALLTPCNSACFLCLWRACFLRCVADVCAALQRMAVYEACSLLRKYDKEYKALQEAMRRGAHIAECVRAIEQA